MGEREKRGGRKTEGERDAPFVCVLSCRGPPLGYGTWTYNTGIVLRVLKW